MGLVELTDTITTARIAIIAVGLAAVVSLVHAQQVQCNEILIVVVLLIRLGTIVRAMALRIGAVYPAVERTVIPAVTVKILIVQINNTGGIFKIPPVFHLTVVKNILLNAGHCCPNASLFSLQSSCLETMYPCRSCFT